MNRLLNWFRREKLESDLDRELRYHIERRTTELKASGLSEGEAHRQAAMELGGVTQLREEVRDAWLTRWLRDFIYDIRFSARSFLSSPSFSATLVLSLALGIGATTAIYSLVSQVLLRSLPVREPERLVLIDWKGEQVASGFGSYNLTSYPLCRDLQSQNQFFEGVLCRAAATVNLSTGGEHKPVAAEVVSGTYFSVLGIQAAIGRVFNKDDDGAPGSSPVVVLAHDYWTSQLGGAQDIIGRKILVNQNPMTVIGVASPTFRGIDVGEVPALWIPASMSSNAIPGFTGLLDRRTRWMQTFGRLQPGLTPAQAQAGLQPWFVSMREEDTKRPGFPNITPERRRNYFASRLEITSAATGHSSLRRRMEQPLWVLFAATGVLLSLACLNVAGLFLARGSARSREISTRLALGASSGRISRQLFADSVLFALAGGLLGVALAPLAVKGLLIFLPRDTAGNSVESSLDIHVLMFALGLSVVAGLLSGLVPALQARRMKLAATLRERGDSGSGNVRMRKAIVTLQIAFSLVLVIGAALFMRTLTGLLAKGPGFATSKLVSFGLEPPRNGYTPAESSRLIRRMYEELREAKIAESVAIVRYQLLRGGSWNNPMTVQGNERIVTQDIHLNAITPDLFQTLGVPVIAGRAFDERDSRPVGEKGGARSAIVNEAFVKRYLGGQNPLGMRVVQGNGPDAKPNIEIVGVVANFSYRGIREESEQAYFPMFEGNDIAGSFYLRVSGRPEDALQNIRSVVQRVDPALPITYLRTIDEQVTRSLNVERILAVLSGAFGILALLLSLVGLYGVMSFVVTQRTREIGIRLALGASGNSAVSLVLRDAGLMILAGIAIALPTIAALGRMVESQLFGVKPTDPLTITTATLVLTVCTFGATLFPAYRAATIDPTEALRFD
jgi:predicted permease